MRILINRQNPLESHLVLHFGLGLIGSEISSALLRLEYQLLADVPFDWRDELHMTNAYNVIKEIYEFNTGKSNRLSFVWSAGETGFYSPQEDADRELGIFQETVNFASMLKDKIETNGFDFHSVSSAGGLYEGQRVIQKSSIPSPIRTYGKLKKSQEDYLLNTFNTAEIKIYRPSSVYGVMTQKSRYGLINNLINNARKGHLTVLDSHVMSLRDYVFAGDIGNHIGRRIRFGRGGSEADPVQFLVSAKCSSIFEVFSKIRRILNLHPQFRYDDQFGNNKNITFSDSVMPESWRPVSLDVGIRRFIVGR